MTDASAAPTRVLLFGQSARKLEDLVQAEPRLELVTGDPEVVVSYGGDGTLLAAEGMWPGLPKAPILNSHRGHRCNAHPPEEVIRGLADGSLARNIYTKLACTLPARFGEGPDLEALNEVTVHMGHINSAVRWRMSLNDEPYENGAELLGDGFLVCTPFGSTAYYNKLTRGIFTKGLGIAFKATTEHTNHLVLPADTVIRFEITRGPAVLAHDSAQRYYDLDAGDAIEIRRHERGAVILTCGPLRKLDEPF